MKTTTDEFWSESYRKGRDYRYATHQFITDLLAHAARSGKKALDIGCGTGQLSRELAHRGYSALGIDASSTAIEIATSLTADTKLRYQQLDIETGELPDEKFALVTCKLVYAFIKDKPAFLERVKSLMDADGVFVIAALLPADVPPEKKGITVDKDQTLSELKAVFPSVDTFVSDGYTCFMARNHSV
jgi:2-polyprenyl-3-methyl-5-hydroxy-6-metoxy-1,4-benzoquinol methylase